MKSRYVKSFAIAALAALGILPVVAQAQLIDLGVATGYAINNAGQVVLSTGIYSDGIITPLPALPGQTTPAAAVAINATGQAAGSAAAQVVLQFGGSGATKAGVVPVTYANGTLTNIALSFPQYTDGALWVEPGAATGINASGEVVGYYTTFSPNSTGIDPAGTVGFIYANGAVTVLPLGQYDPNFIIPLNNPFAINDSGQITGTYATAGPKCQPALGCVQSDAYIYDSATGAATDLGWGTGYAINNAGQVTGTLDEVTFNSSGTGTGPATITGSHAFLYTDGTTNSLGTLPGANDGTGYAINSSGQVVGSSGGHAFFYNGAMNDLNTLISATDPLKSYVTLTSAVGINDSLLILVNGVDSRANSTHAYLYQASSIQLAPATLDFAMLAVGGTSLAQSVTVTNTGTTAIAFSPAYVNGDFSLRADNCGASLAPGDQCRISVVFLPKVAGALSGKLTIPAGGANYQVPLSGVAPITAKISASSSTATVGQPVTLTWTVSPGSTCIAASSSTNANWTASNPPFAGTESLSGTRTLTETVNGTVTYTLNCTAPGAAAVSVSTSVAWAWPAVSISISASPTTIIAGQSTTITWTASNATSCTATGGGPADMWAGSKATSGSQTVTESFALETPSVVLTFGITCNSTVTGLSGQSSVNVTEDRAAGGSGGGSVSATISAAPTTITVGQSTTLTWTSSNATSCTATGGGTDDSWAGSKAMSGSQTVTEAATLSTSSVVLTFGITCNSSSTGQSGKASVNVTENQANGGSGTGGAVTATISASPTTITVGQSTTLTWTSSNATSCTATGGGTDDSWAGTKAASGSQTVTEAAALDTSSVVLTFAITCNSSTTGQSGKASVNVTENQAAATSGGGTPPASSGGGGGALDWLSLAFLAGIFALRRLVRIAGQQSVLAGGA